MRGWKGGGGARISRRFLQRWKNIREDENASRHRFEEQRILRLLKEGMFIYVRI